MRKDCDTCLHDEFGETYCNDCYWANGKPPTKWEPAPFWTPDTNADRIRAMSDEELARVIDAFNAYFDECNRSVDEIDCINCELCALCSIGENKAIKWLQQPAKEGADNG